MLIAVFALRVGSSMHLFEPRGFVAVALYVMFSLNLLLGIFNLLPAPPLDGSTAIMLFMSESQAQSYLGWIRGGNFAMPGLLVSLIVFRYIFPEIDRFAMRLFF
jgi:Zn-dependent protease